MRDGTRSQGALGRRVVLWLLAGGFLVHTLSKHMCFLIRFDGLFTLRLMGSTRLVRSTIYPAIHHREALVCSLGVEVVSETKLVG
jgi:hypothetical protein